MSSEPVQSGTDAPYVIAGDDAASVVRSVERGVASGALRPNETVPSVRALARELSLSPTTVAAAYRDLRQRGVLVSYDRSRTVVAHRAPIAVRIAPELSDDVVDLTDGSPDLDLLPDLAPALARIDPVQRLYGEDVASPELVERVRASLAADGVSTEHLAIVGGALDGIERVLELHCHHGDAIAVEDPGYAATLDLLRTLGLYPVPVPIDDAGMLPDGLASALDRGVRAVLVVPRAQNPTGAALTSDRAQQLRNVLADHPEPLVIEDDHAGRIAGAPHRTIIAQRRRWAVVRSLSKTLGPDLRIAALAGDEYTVTRVIGRQRLGTGWVSRILQDLAAAAWDQATADGTIERAEQAYTKRREALLTALSEHGLQCSGRSGLNVWVPVAEEVPVVQGMAVRGWAVQAGEPYRIAASPGIRVTVSRLRADDAVPFAAALAATLRRQPQSRRG